MRCRTLLRKKKATVGVAAILKTRVLVAEDHPAMRATVVGVLQLDFDVVASVADGQAAVEAASTLLPDVLVLDVSMPILDGPEVARRVKAQGCKATVVFISVSDDVTQISMCLAAGGDAFVTKMRAATDLIHAINEALAGRSFFSPGRP